MNTINTINDRRRGQLGFTIIESLISLVIMGFGILSLAGMHAALSRNSDDAKQRTEAVRLAQEKIESFRSYTGIASTVIGQGTTLTTALNWDALAGSTDIITTNAAYTRTWALGDSSGDTMRGLTVGVAWTDRAGQIQRVSLSSLLSKTNPADSGFLGFPLPLNTNLKRPKDRNLDIPIPAINLGNGESAVKFGAAGQYVLFGNISGDVVKICTPSLVGAPTSAEVIAALTSANLGTRNCTPVNGYIVAGYVGRVSSSAVPNTVFDALSIDHSDIDRNAAGNTGISCQFGDAINQNTNATIADFKYYLCVIPLVAPTPALTVNGPYNWSDTVRIAGPSAWRSSGSKYYVCRYEYTVTNSLTDVNQRNVQPYVQVNKSIDQQNYLVLTTADATSTTAPSCPSSMTVAGVSLGVVHQDCRSASNPGNFGTHCPPLSGFAVTYNVNNGTGFVPTDATAYTSGSTVTVLASPSPTRSGFSFGGWSLTSTGAAVTSFSITANTTLYAKWTLTAVILASPAPVWTGSTNPKTLTWPAVTNATGYLVSTCTNTNDNALNACIPTGSTNNSTAVLSPAPSSKDTICYHIVAVGSAAVARRRRQRFACLRTALAKPATSTSSSRRVPGCFALAAISPSITAAPPCRNSSSR